MIDWNTEEIGQQYRIHILVRNLRRSNGGKIAVEPFEYSHGGHIYKKAHISDLDGYNLVLSARRSQTDDPISQDQESKFKKTFQVRLVSDSLIVEEVRRYHLASRGSASRIGVSGLDMGELMACDYLFVGLI